MTINKYLSNITQLYRTGLAREHSYRSDLQVLISYLLPNVLVTNEPARVSCGAPDYMLTKKDIPVGYIEAKDIGVNLDNKNLKEQFDRYKAGLSNLIITDYLHFRFYKDGEYITKISIAELIGDEIIPKPENFSQFIHLVENFALTVSQNIKSPSRLATMMAGKAKLMADVIEKSLNRDDEEDKRTNLKSQMISFKEMLIHDITNKGFADIYSQTIAYGMFAARYHDPSLESFSRTEAAQLIPKSNPFLRKLFHDIAGYDLDKRLVWIVDELVNIFLASDVMKIMKNFGKATKQEDPVVHFYETFLGEYNPALRKSRGVWYTPQPVVNFIVRAVDDILKVEFGLSDGLADTSKTDTTVRVPTHDKRFTAGYRDYIKKVHRVQILDPATGTGTFLAEVMKVIFSKFRGQEGIWSNYVSKNLLPRIHGFELLMASYAMAHLKLDMYLTETGYKSSESVRLGVYLTNSLEDAHPDTSTLFSSWLSDEANQANTIKRDTPVMCVIGNPPYSVSSSNKNEWIESLMEEYKRGLNERNIQPLSDDYIKFIRYGQYYIDKNGSGILAYISNNSFIDGMIHRQMRKSLSESFDRIYILDLHGSAKKNEKTRSGELDKNVFDIQQGVSINIFVKTGKVRKTQINHFDLLGSREYKYAQLSTNSVASIKWKTLDSKKPHFFFVPKDFSNQKKYEEGFKITDLMEVQACGMVTARDSLLVNFMREEAEKVIEDFSNIPEQDFRNKYSIHKDSRDWTYSGAKDDSLIALVKEVEYRPFDIRFVPYTPNSKGVLSYPRNEIMKYMLNQDNIGLLLCKQQSTFDFQHAFITKTISDKCTLSSQTKEAGYHFPLFINNENGFDGEEIQSNLNLKILNEFEKLTNLKFSQLEESNSNSGIFNSWDMLDYIYAVLYSPKYRLDYKELLKLDFPRIPYPLNSLQFFRLVKVGKKLRKLHTLDDVEISDLITGFPVNGDNIISRKITKTSPGYEKQNETHGKVWINEHQYFDKIPSIAWEFYIGGYQPAQKWLKDRKGRELSYKEILHYQKIILALFETNRLMREIDEVLFDYKEEVIIVNN